MLTGHTGSGKTLLANIMAADMGGTVYKPDCTNDSATSEAIDRIKQDLVQDTLYSGMNAYIFNEADQLHPRNIAKLKTVIDTIDDRRHAQLLCNVTVFFTTAQTKCQLTPVQQKHWNELSTRCINLEVEVTPQEMNAYFARLTNGKIPDINRRISECSMRKAWEYIEKHKVVIVED
jgi:gluconate kinase